MKPLLWLVMIVKNEAASMRAVLASVLPFIDGGVILDTGSNDGTQEIVREFAEKKELLLFEEPYVAFDKIPGNVIDFAATRNRALELAGGKAEFTLMLSGDETLEGGEELRAFLEAKRSEGGDAYCVTMKQGAMLWPFPRILRTTGGRRYIHPIHEIPVDKAGESIAPLVPGVTVVFDAVDQERFRRRMETVDVPLLTYFSNLQPKNHEEEGERARALLKLGMTYEALADFYPKEHTSPWLTHKMSAMGYYWRRSELDGDPFDVAYANFHFINIAAITGLLRDQELVERLIWFVKHDARRPELRYMLAAHVAKDDPKQGLPLAEEAAKIAREVRENPPPFPIDTRTEWLSYRIAAACAAFLKQPKRARAMAEAGLAAGGPKTEFAEYLDA